MSLRALVSGVGEPNVPFFAVRTLEVELSETIPAITGESATGLAPYVSARVLVRLHHHPIGFVEVDVSGGPVAPAELEQQIWAEFGPAVLPDLTADGLGQTG